MITADPLDWNTLAENGIAYNYMTQPDQELLGNPNKPPEDKEMKEIKQTIKTYRQMFLFLTFTSATLAFSGLPQVNYIKNELHATPAEMIIFSTTTRLGAFLKPLMGHVLDKYSICGYKIKSYTLIYAIGSSLVYLSIAFYSTNIFVLCFQVSLTVILDCTGGDLAQGMTAITLKYQKKLKELESSKSKTHEGANFGYLQVMGNFIRTLCTFIGGFYGTELAFPTVYLILSGFPILLSLYSICCFSEQRKIDLKPTKKEGEEAVPVPQAGKSLFQNVGTVKDILLSDGLRFPVILLIITLLIPTYGDFFIFLLTDKDFAGWNFKDLAISNLVTGLIYGLLMGMLLSQLSKLPFPRLMLVGSGAYSITSLFFLSLPYSNHFSFSEIFALNVAGSVTGGVGSDSMIISIMGRFSTKCPKGLENLGIATIATLIILAGIISGYASSPLVVAFDIKEGSYSNVRVPMMITVGCRMLVFFFVPLLVRK